MKEEKHVIVDVSTPKNEEEKDKFIKAKIVAHLLGGAICEISLGIVSTIIMEQMLTTDNILGILTSGISMIGSGISAYSTLYTTFKYVKSDLDSELTNTESEGKTR